MSHSQSQVSKSQSGVFKLVLPKSLKRYRNESLLAVTLILSSLIWDIPNSGKLVQVGEATGELVVEISVHGANMIAGYIGDKEFELASQP
ncbi:MAG: hypothetical protein OQJ91_14965 [Motiliproteus sp.]|nr:hypothetical protein [Motiliproteus sp.]